MFSPEYYDESDYYAAMGWHKEDTKIKQEHAEVLESLIRHLYGEEPLDANWIDINIQDLASYFGVRMPCKTIDLKGRV